MGFVRKVKERMADELAKRYASFPNFVLVDFRKLKGRDATALRKELKTEGVKLNVVKNSVARFAFDKIGLKDVAKGLEGMNAVVYGEDPVAIAKKVHEFIDKAKVLSVKGGMMEGRPIPAAQIKELSRLPGKKEMHGILVGTIASPVVSFVGVLNNVIGTFLLTLSAVGEKLPKEEEKKS